MLGKVFKKEKKEKSSNEEIANRVSKMNITEMRTYVNNKIKDFEICSDGLVEVLKRLVHEDKNTSKRYLQIDDMDTKKKKAFDLINIIARSKKISMPAVELIQEFTVVYEDIINKYDKDYKEIYSSRFKDSINKSIEIMGEIAMFERKRGVLGE